MEYGVGWGQGKYRIKGHWQKLRKTGMTSSFPSNLYKQCRHK